jgi:hypothetical protein
MRLIRSTFYFVLAVGIFSALASDPETPERLEQRVKEGDTRAILQAGEMGRKDLIPIIENFANDDAWARAALAKLGIRKYVDEILLSLTNATHFSTSAHGVLQAGGSEKMSHEVIFGQMNAFKKLAYINDPSTVKIIAAYLYDTANHYPEPPPGAIDRLLWTSNAELAIDALRQMIKEPPDAGKSLSVDERIKLWQQWWEQNKDKYP